jgi:hypothetical protein
MSNSEVMNIICDSWKKYDELVNSVGQYDPCKLLYAQCIVNDINVVSFDIVCCIVILWPVTRCGFTKFRKIMEHSKFFSSEYAKIGLQNKQSPQ